MDRMMDGTHQTDEYNNNKNTYNKIPENKKKEGSFGFCTCLFGLFRREGMVRRRKTTTYGLLHAFMCVVLAGCFFFFFFHQFLLLHFFPS